MRSTKKYSASILMIGWFCFMTSSCQSPPFNYPNIGSYDPDSFSTTTPTAQIEQLLTLEDLTTYFPEKIDGLRRTAIHVRRQDKTATAIYGDNLYSISITDDSFNHHSNLAAFDKEYMDKNPKEKNKKRIATVLDGYRTLTSIQDNKVSISFIFKNRYLIVVTGYQPQSPYRVWQFIELNAFRKLP